MATKKKRTTLQMKLIKAESTGYYRGYDDGKRAGAKEARGKMLEALGLADLEQRVYKLENPELY